MRFFLKTENWIYLTVFFLPSYLVRFSVFGVPTNVLELLILITFLAWFLETKNRYFLLINLGKKHKYYFYFILLLFLGLISSAVFGENWLVSFGIIKSWFFFPLLFFAIVFLTIPEDKTVSVWRAFYLSGFWVSLAALAYKLACEVTFDGRLQAIFNSPNYLAMYLAPAFIIGIVQSSKYKTQNYNSKLKIIFLISLLTISSALYLTYSYAAFLSLGVTFFVLGMILKKINLKLILVGSIIFLSLFYFQLGSEKMDRVLALDNRSSLSSRTMIWNASAKILSDHWVLGIGAGDFQEKYLEYQKFFPPYLEWAVPHPHNLFLAVWFSAGILGLMSFFGILFFWFWNFFSSKTVETRPCLVSTTNTMKIISLGILLYFLLHGLVDTAYFKNDLSILFWLCFLATKK